MKIKIYNSTETKLMVERYKTCNDYNKDLKPQFKPEVNDWNNKDAIVFFNNDHDFHWNLIILCNTKSLMRIPFKLNNYIKINEYLGKHRILK